MNKYVQINTNLNIMIIKKKKKIFKTITPKEKVLEPFFAENLMPFNYVLHRFCRQTNCFHENSEKRKYGSYFARCRTKLRVD